MSDNETPNTRAGVLRWTADLLSSHGPVPNYELNHDGSTDPLRAAYVEGQFDAWSLVNHHALEAESQDAVPVPADTAALIAASDKWLADPRNTADGYSLVATMRAALDHLSRENVRLQMQVKEAALSLERPRSECL